MPADGSREVCPTTSTPTYEYIHSSMYVPLSFFQIDPRCLVQYVHWYHEPLDGPEKDKRVLFKTAGDPGEPYVHTIASVHRAHLGKYTCEIANVVGVTKCTAHLSVRDGADMATAMSARTMLALAMAARVISYLHLV